MTRHIAQLLLLCVLPLFAACQEEPHPADSYPEPFSGQVLQGDSLISPVPQRISQRTFEDSTTVVLRQYTVFPDSASSGTPPERMMKMPIAAGLDSREETLYVMDTESLLINKYDVASAELTDVITSAKDAHEPSNYGAGLRMISDEEMWLYGVKKARITQMSTTGDLGRDIKFKSGEHHAVSTSGNYVVRRINDDIELFHTYTSKDKAQASFGILSSEKIELNGESFKGHGMGFMGSVISDGTDSFVYAAQFGGVLLRYKMDGSLQYFREAIKPGSFPGLAAYTPSGPNSWSIDDGVSNHISYPINEWNGTIYYFVTEKGEDSTRWMIDAYDYDNGDYLYSINRRETCRYIFITDEHIYAHCIDPGGFVQFKREGPPEVLPVTDLAEL
ncbi:MAG: hypothetical protein AAF564_19595 [Bacteroidota bacterium]